MTAHLSTNPPSASQIIAKKYLIVRKLGEGGMGAVYEARHRVTKKRFALKWLVPRLEGDGDAMQRFVREAQAACAIEHPNVVEVYDVGSDDGAMYLVMQYLHGETLGELMARGPLDPSALMTVAEPLLDALACAHESNVVHRDIKPENIFLCENRSGKVVPKILDFGLSKITHPTGEHAKSGMRLTASGQMMGTPYYMAPEQVTDAATVDGRADIYSFASMMYEALAGHVPLSADRFPALVVKITTERPKHIATIRPDIPKSLANAIMQGLEKKAEARFDSVRDFAAALDGFRVSGPTANDEIAFDTTLDSGDRRVTNSTAPLAPASSDPGLPDRARYESSIHVPTHRANKPLLLGAGAATLLGAALAAWFFLAGPPAASTPDAIGAEPAAPPQEPVASSEPVSEPGPSVVEPSPAAPPAPSDVAAPETAEVEEAEEAEEEEAPTPRQEHEPRARQRHRRPALAAESTARPGSAGMIESAMSAPAAPAQSAPAQSAPGPAMGQVLESPTMSNEPRYDPRVDDF